MVDADVKNRRVAEIHLERQQWIVLKVILSEHVAGRMLDDRAGRRTWTGDLSLVHADRTDVHQHFSLPVSGAQLIWSSSCPTCA